MDNASWKTTGKKTARDLAEGVLNDWLGKHAESLVDEIELAIERETERMWWAGFENAADIAKGERIEDTLRSKIEFFRSKRTTER